jgi:hypothetical protein
MAGGGGGCSQTLCLHEGRLAVRRRLNYIVAASTRLGSIKWPASPLASRALAAFIHRLAKLWSNFANSWVKCQSAAVTLLVQNGHFMIQVASFDSMMMSRVLYRERQPGGQHRVLQKRDMQIFVCFDRRWPPVFATLFCYLGTSDFEVSFQPR